MDPLALIRSLIPLVRPIRDKGSGFPDSFCDVVTAQIVLVARVPGSKARCGKVGGQWHLWVQFGHINVDFTASQFSSLKPYVVGVDGFYVLYGTDAYFQSLGVQILPPGQCSMQLEAAVSSLLCGEYGTGACPLNLG